MAKMIKCPTCQTQIEVPATLTGQVVKCPGCGKGLKLVAKKKDPAGGSKPGQLTAGGSPINPNGSISGGSMAGTMAGGSVSAMSFHDEPPPQDDLPGLDTNCQVCGRPTPFDELSEDNGKMVCRDCIKGARSSIARAAGGAETIGFKAAEYRPTRRASMINVTPGFLAAVFLGLVWIGCQMFLSFNPKPIGKGNTAQAHAVKGRPGTPGDLSKAPTTIASATTAPMTSAEANAAATQPAPNESASPGTTVAGTQPSETGVPTTQGVGVALVPPKPGDGTIFNDNGSPAVPPAQPIAPAPAPGVAATDPLDRGQERLLARDYDAAFREFTDARKKYPLKLQAGVNSPQAQTTMEGLLASSLGMYLKHPANSDLLKNTRTYLDNCYKAGIRTRSLALNGAIASISSPTGPNVLTTLADMLKAQMEQHRDDEYAADVFGTLVNKLASAPSLPTGSKEKIEAYWTFLDSYVDAMSAKNEGKLKWGVEWIAADEVKMYRPLRNVSRDNSSVTKAAKDVDAANRLVHAAESALTLQQQRKAAGQPADVQGAQNQLDAANVAFTKAQKAMEEANSMLKYRKPRWLETFEPVIPETAAAP